MITALFCEIRLDWQYGNLSDTLAITGNLEIAMEKLSEDGDWTG